MFIRSSSLITEGTEAAINRSTSSENFLELDYLSKLYNPNLDVDANTSVYSSSTPRLHWNGQFH